MTTKIYVGDTGTVITLDCGTDISTATELSIEVRRPDGATTSWEALASGTNGIAYITQAGTFDQAGNWRLQARVTMPTGTWRGETAIIAVADAFG